MTKLLRNSSASNANDASDGPVDAGDPIPASTFEPPLELVLAPKRSDGRRRFAYIGVSVAIALTIGYLSGSGTGLKRFLGVGDGPEQAELAQALPPNSELTTATSDKQEIARLINEIDSMRARIEQVRHSADNLHASERLRALEEAREQSGEAAKTNTDIMARLDKLETRLAQLEHSTLIAKPSDNPEMNNRAADQKAASHLKAIADYALHHVDRGHAFVKRSDGFLEEVVPGDELPGAGRVTAIERRDDRWIVMTTQGIIIQRP
jgi:hypothetical protein